jgi:uncharacterized alkaline shock family protein YloU
LAAVQRIIKNVRGDRVNIANEVVIAIVEMAISEMEGNAFPADGLSGLECGSAGGVAGLSVKKGIAAEGIKVKIREKEAEIELSVTVAYGCNVNETAKNIQATIREKVEGITNLHVAEVVVNILGIDNAVTRNE